MSRLILLALAVLTVGSASAQPDPADYLPLDEGNRWVYVTDYSYRYSNAPQRNRAYRTGSTEWLALGLREVAGEMLPAVRITETTEAEVVTVVDCTVRFAPTPDVFGYDFRALSDGSPCSAGFFKHQTAPYPGYIQPFNPTVSTETFTVGDISYPARSRVRGSTGGIPIASTVSVEGVGLTRFALIVPAASQYPGWGATLRYAEVGGEVFGRPLELPASLTPFEAGDEWVYRVDSAAPEAPDFVVWQVTAAGDLRVSRRDDGEATLLDECAVHIREARPATSWVPSVSFGDAPQYRCATSVPSALPRLVRETNASPPYSNGYEVASLALAQSVTVGTTTVVASTFSAEHTNRDVPGFFTSSFSGADGIGLTQFANLEPGGVPHTSTLVYARVGGETFGASPISADEGASETSRLNVRLGPNPARSGTMLYLDGGLAPSARVTVLDTRGRRVLETEADVPGAVRIETSGLAAGVYVVRVETAGETLTRRLAVVR